VAFKKQMRVSPRAYRAEMRGTAGKADAGRMRPRG
jgi:hypothetical protein